MTIFPLFSQPDVPPYLSEEQLNALLEGCMQSLRRGCDLNLTRCQENSVERMSPCDIFEENMPDSRNEVLDDIQLSENEEMLGEEYKDIFSKEKIDSCYNPSKTFFEFPMSEKKGNEEDQEEAPDTANGSEDFFMSKVLSIDKMKKPPFLDEPFYCVSMNNELSTDASIPSIPLKTRGGEAFNKLLDQAFDYDYKSPDKSSQAGFHQTYALMFDGYAGYAQKHRIMLRIADHFKMFSDIFFTDINSNDTSSLLKSAKNNVFVS